MSSSAASTDLHALQTCGDDVIRTVNLLCSVSPRHDACGEFGNELHELSLSTGTMDRQMFHFVCDVLLEGTAIDPRSATDSSLRNALSLATRTPHVKRTSLLRGGVASFYFLTSLVLREARLAIRRASTIDKGNYMRRRMLSGSAVAFMILQTGKWLLRYSRLPRMLPTLYSAVYAGLASWVAITYFQMRRPLNKLKQCNKRLLHLLRMWSILQSVVAQASLRRAVSYVELDSIGRNQSSGQGSAAHGTGAGGGMAAKSFLSLVALPNREDKHQRHDRSTYRGLLSFAPPPVSGAFWYDDGGVVSQYGIKHGLNVLYACCRFALGVTGLKWYYPLGYCLQLMALPYFAFQPNLAASWAHSFIVDANAQMIQAAWSPMMNKVAVPIAMALHAKWRLPVCDHVQLGEGGPGAYIFCATPLPQLGPRPKVLFYFFGGGFIGNLFSGDISFVTSWARAFPDVIIVCPQYDIAPEPYPVALNQCVAAYKAVMQQGILGCTPCSCVISGQSAGGMLAAALCVRLAQNRGGEKSRGGYSKRSAMTAGDGGGTAVSNGSSVSSYRSKHPRNHHNKSSIGDEVRALVMWYPTLNASLAPSPSRVLFVNDVLLPHGLTSAAVDSYVPENKDANDPCCSPVFASDETLARFPQTYIIAAGLDPLLDDSVDFHTRLCRNRSPAKLKIWRGLTHGFMNMEAVNAEAAEAQASSVEMLREALYK